MLHFGITSGVDLVLIPSAQGDGDTRIEIYDSAQLKT